MIAASGTVVGPMTGFFGVGSFVIVPALAADFFLACAYAVHVVGIALAAGGSAGCSARNDVFVRLIIQMEPVR